MIITKELLIKNGWELHKDPIRESLTEDDKKQLDAEGINYNFEEYTYTARNFGPNDWKEVWFLTMRYDLSNTINRDWSCHIDNNCHESVACVDVGTVEHFNKLMDLMDIAYRL